MAIYVSKAAYFSYNSVDLSDHVKQVTINTGFEAVDSTAMTNNTRLASQGLKTWSIEVDLYQDTASSKVDQTIGPDVITATARTVEVRPTNAGRSATNPGYNGSGIIESYVPVQGAVGEMAIARLTIKAAGDLSRSTA